VLGPRRGGRIDPRPERSDLRLARRRQAARAELTARGKTDREARLARILLERSDDRSTTSSRVLAHQADTPRAEACRAADLDVVAIEGAGAARLLRRATRPEAHRVASANDVRGDDRFEAERFESAISRRAAVSRFARLRLNLDATQGFREPDAAIGAVWWCGARRSSREQVEVKYQPAPAPCGARAFERAPKDAVQASGRKHFRRAVASMSHASSATAMPPSEVTQSSTTSAPAPRAARAIASTGWQAPVDVSACTNATSDGRTRAITAAIASSSSTEPHSASTRVTRAPWRLATSHMRSPKTPATPITTSSPGSTRFWKQVSMPPLPVASGIVSRFRCRRVDRLACTRPPVEKRGIR
jgi:hypothetical protein